MLSQEDTVRIARINDYWFGSELSPAAINEQVKHWYSADLDDEIRTLFGTDVEAALGERLLHWSEIAAGSLALVVLLDQFTRNIYRKSAQAFAGDPLARAISLRAIASEQLTELRVPEQVLLIHPLHHSEDQRDHAQVLALLKLLKNDAASVWHEFLDETLMWFREHSEVVRRFGRFPHRNDVLRRTSTEEELAYLADAKTYGQ